MQRFPKKYRHPDLDAKLTRERISMEARCMQRARRGGLDVPTVYFVEIPRGRIYMERVHGVTAKAYLASEHVTPADRASLAAAIGEGIARLHNSGLVHGDLTTSNVMIRGLTHDATGALAGAETLVHASESSVDGASAAVGAAPAAVPAETPLTTDAAAASSTGTASSSAAPLALPLKRKASDFVAGSAAAGATGGAATAAASAADVAAAAALPPPAPFPYKVVRCASLCASAVRTPALAPSSRCRCLCRPPPDCRHSSTSGWLRTAPWATTRSGASTCTSCSAPSPAGTRRRRRTGL